MSKLLVLVVLTLAVVIAGGLVTMALWSWLVPALLPGFVARAYIAPEISFLHACGISFLVRAIGFGSPGKA